jgi:hypothetical protein
MKQKSKHEEKLSRRHFFPLVGSSLLIPFLGFGENDLDNGTHSNNDEFETLLKPDGTTVKVRVKTVKESKVIKKKVSNKSLLKWLNKKL